MFDPDEPAFVVARERGKRRYVVERNAAGKIAVLDELNARPPAQ